MSPLNRFDPIYSNSGRTSKDRQQYRARCPRLRQRRTRTGGRFDSRRWSPRPSLPHCWRCGSLRLCFGAAATSRRPRPSSGTTAGPAPSARGRIFKRARRLDRALEIDNSFALAHARRSEAYAEIELTDRAREELLQAMALLPDRSTSVRTPSRCIWTPSPQH